jgi:hypothetical protein
MFQQLARPAKAVAACLTLVSAVACSGSGAIDSPNAPSLTSNTARTDTPVDPPPPPPPPPPKGGEGCTPGYWKQPHHFDSWPAPYTPGDSFTSTFGVDTFGDDTLVEVLGANGGGVNALGRHAVAALLNGASDGVSYDMTSQQVIMAFNAALASGGDIEGTKNIFAGFNEQGCKLN